MAINRPDLKYDDKRHAYTLDGEKLLGVSTVAKIGEDNIWGVASAWAFRIGYEGAVDVFNEANEWFPHTKDGMREELKQRRKTPWHNRDKAAKRGTAIHDALEHLAQKGEVPILEQFPKAEQGYVQALCRWYVDYRPEFVATEVQVVSEKHGFAGRYDVRAYLDEKLTLIDLKTSKRVYPTSHFVQLAGYELASQEMGYDPTDAQYILRVDKGGSYEMVRSIAILDDFLACLATAKAIERIKKDAQNS